MGRRTARGNCPAPCPMNVDEALITPQLEMRWEIVLRATLEIKAEKTVEFSNSVPNVQNRHQQCAEQRANHPENSGEHEKPSVHRHGEEQNPQGESDPQ